MRGRLPASRDRRLPLPGTLLVREYKGQSVVVKVLDEGFEYEGRRHKSLSTIAREVTGTKWNGFLFFGLAGDGTRRTPLARGERRPGRPLGPRVLRAPDLHDPATRLPAIDRLEGFLPGGPSLYRRVLVPASTRGRRVLVWLYMKGAGGRHPGRRLANGVWRA